MKKLILSIALLIICFSFSYAQNFGKPEPYRKWEIGINGGGSIFTGEWNMSKDDLFSHYSQWNNQLIWSYGLWLKKNFTNVFALEVNWNHSNITGDWKYNTIPFSDFRTQVIQTDLNSVWNLTNLFSKNRFDRRIYWYGKLGAGISHLWRREGVYPLFHDNQWKLTIPIGTGVAYRFTKHLKLSAGVTWSWLNTDRLDAMKTEILNAKSANYETAVFGTKLYPYLGVSYVFGKRKKPAPIIETSKPQPIPDLKPEPKPEVKPIVKAKSAAIGNAYKVYFEFDKWNLNNQTVTDLDRLVRDMKENPEVNVDIKSHADSRGPASYNMKLSEKRSKSVIDYLVGRGISVSRINAHAFGETDLVNKCKDGIPCKKAEHALNRRTETVVIE